MEQSFLVFLAGSLLSYLPLYRLFNRRWVSRTLHRRSSLIADKIAGPRRVFLDSLRQEAAIRARATVRAALANERTPERPPISAAANAFTLTRLQETRSMVAALLPADATALFDRILGICYATSATDRSELHILMQQLDVRLGDVIGTTAIGAERTSLASDLAAPMAN